MVSCSGSRETVNVSVLGMKLLDQSETKAVVPILSKGTTSLHAHEPSDETNRYEALYRERERERIFQEGPEADPCLRRPCTG